MIEMRLHGYGGEGVVTMAYMIAEAGLKTGKVVQALPSFGVERRGAPVVAAVRISDEDILIRSKSYEPDLLLVLNSKLLELAVHEGIKDNTVIILNATDTETVADEYSKWPMIRIDLTGIAMRENLILRGVPTINVPSLGALGCYLGIPLDKLQETITEKWAGKVGERNAEVAAIAYQEMQGRL